MSARPFMLFTLLVLGWPSAVEATITIDEALSLSQRTGRPLLAVAGSKT